MRVRSLVQFSDGVQRGVAALDPEGRAWRLQDTPRVRDLAAAAIDESCSLAELAAVRAADQIDLATVRLLCPVDHPDLAHLHATGTGLTHLGSADGRDKMHEAAAAGAATDSMRMFLMGLDGGKPAPGEVGVQPEWFYKCNGSMLVATGEPLTRPGFAGDGGEEPEIAGIYLIDGEGTPRRLGFALANEFSDHVTERVNYLWLAHSKLRPAALGPELLFGELPETVTGSVRIWRDGRVLWEKPFQSGAAVMSHSITNLEHHHFKYAQFRRPGDLHVHFFGTATRSFSDNIETREGDDFEITADAFCLPLRNPMACQPDQGLVSVKSL